MKQSTCFPGSYDVIWRLLVAFVTVSFIIDNFVIIIFIAFPFMRPQMYK